MLFGLHPLTHSDAAQARVCFDAQGGHTTVPLLKLSGSRNPVEPAAPVLNYRRDFFADHGRRDL